MLWIMNTATRSSSRSKKCVPAAPDQSKVPAEVRLPAAAGSVTTRTPRDQAVVDVAVEMFVEALEPLR